MRIDRLHGRKKLTAATYVSLMALAVFVLPGCPGVDLLSLLGVSTTSGVYNNTTDPTNNNANYIGSDACKSCHPDIAALHNISGHSFKLQRITGQPPTYAPEGTRAGVPNPPDGKTWDDVAYIIGGYIRKGRFIDLNGYIMTFDVDGVDTQWNLNFPPNGTTTGFVAYEDAGKFSPANPKPYDYSCFQCHTTGAMEQDPANPEFQDNRPGHAGTWQEEGIQCEACHGPGSNHIPNPSARDNYVNTAASACGACHTRGDDENVIPASGGYIRHHEQWQELLSSGGHAGFNCVNCHNPHGSPNYDRDNAIRNDCTDCHSDQNMTLFHKDRVFIRGDYVEELSCMSCHMTYATKSAAAATEAVVGTDGRMGDMRTHIFRINTNAVDYNSMFSADGSQVVRDADGKAAVTLDFVCLRCHNGLANPPALTISAASTIAAGIHQIGQ